MRKRLRNSDILSFLQARPRGIARMLALLILFTFTFAVRPQAPAQESISGMSGVATKRAVVNFSDLAAKEAMAPVTLREPKVIHPPMPIPQELPVPGDFVPGEEARPVPEKALIPLPSSPEPASSFLALEDNNTSIPPDTHGAVGPNHLMVTLNSQVRIQDRTGGEISTVSLDSFWASVGPFTTITGPFDPKVLYDPFSNRWMFVACAGPQSASSSVLIGVSQTSNPTGSWNLYRVDGDAADQVWVDYPSIGFNKSWIVVQVNMFNVSNNAFNRSHVYAFNKADLLAGGSGTFTLFERTDISGTQVPAITYDNDLSTLYLLQNFNGNFSGNGYLRIYTIAGSVGSEVFTEGSFVVTANPWDSSPPGEADFAPQLGSAQKIQNNDARMQNLVYRNGSLWTTHTIFLPAGGSSTRSAVQWWEIAPSGTINQRGRIDDETGSLFRAFPSIAVNKNNDVLIGYSRFSATQYASANYSFRAAVDPANSLRSDTVLKEGEASYYKTFGSSRNRWGDFSNTVVDPVNDTDMWTIQEYAASPSGGFDRWGTWWGRIVPPEVVGPLAMNASTLPEGEVGVAYNGDLEIGGGVTPYEVKLVKGLLPEGLNFDSDGVITGVPTVAKSASFTVQVTDDASTSVTKKFKIKVFKALGISTSSLKAGTVGKKYSAALKVTGGKKPYAWSIVSGSLPGGLVLDGTTGKITGTPAAAGSSELTFKVTDPLGGEEEKTLTLTVN